MLAGRLGLGAVAVTVEGSLTVVAKQRFCARSEGREESKSAEAIKRLVGGLMAAMAVYVDVFRIRRGGVGVEVIVAQCCSVRLTISWDRRQGARTAAKGSAR